MSVGGRGLASEAGTAAPASASTTSTAPTAGRPPSRRWLYPLVVAVGALSLVLGLTPGSLPLPAIEPVYVLLGAALLAGYLLVTRLRPGEPATSLAAVPALVAAMHLGPQALPLVALAALAAGLARRVRPVAALAAAAHETLAFGLAALAGRAAAATSPPFSEAAAFVVVFATVRAGLAVLARRLDVPPASDVRAEQPSLLLSLLLAPLGALPLLAAVRGGDGALLLTLAAQLALLFVVREAANLATLRAEAEAERERLARAVELQEELIYLITHEVKNPLTMVRAYAQLGLTAAERGELDRLPAYLANVDRGGAAIERLVENLLQLSRLEQTGDLPPSERVDLAALAAEVAAELEPLAQTKRQRVLLEVAEGLDPALVPRLLLREALSNLVSNAIKYTPPEGTVTVWARTASVPGRLLLGVTDTGIGLSEEDQARLFSRFFRSADPRARQERGSGLGLALTRTIVQRMGGEVEVRSVLNQGTTFQLLLPAAPTA